MAKKTYDELSTEEVTRWISLLSSIDLIDKYCLATGKDFETIEIKIPAIKHYMTESMESIRLLQSEDQKHESNKTIDSIRAKITKNFLNNISTKHPDKTKRVLVKNLF